MSLTSILTDSKNQELREKFKAEFPKPKFNFNNELLVQPYTTNYGIIGTAFDYLLRFTIQFLNKDRIIESNTWVAEGAFKLLMKRFESKDNKALTLTNRYQNAIRRHSEYINNGIVSDELLADTLFLAKLDLFVRSRIIAPDLFRENINDIQDLNELYKVINHEIFRCQDKCYLNPHFGSATQLVGGADADLIVDNILIEVKVTKKLKLKREYLNQLIGYYLLSLIGSVNRDRPRHRINKIGVYFARYGFLWTIDIDSIVNPQSVETMKKWFEEYCHKLLEEQTQATLKFAAPRRR
jgi:hypothetical protein